VGGLIYGVVGVIEYKISGEQERLRIWASYVKMHRRGRLIEGVCVQARFDDNDIVLSAADAHRPYRDADRE